MPRNTHALIHLDAIKANYQLANKLAPQSKNIAVIKADAYGHGSIKIAQLLEPMVPAFAVAIFEEAVALREAGINIPILVLQGINHQQELIYAASHDIWTMLVNADQLELIVKTALKSALNVWLKLDTGMHRLGFNIADLTKVIERLKHCNWVANEMVLSSHLACASDIENNMTCQQCQQFEKDLAGLITQFNLTTSIANSAGLINFPATRLDWNRPGIMLYGLSPFDQPHPKDNLLNPAMTFASSVVAIQQLGKGDRIGYGLIWQAQRPSTIAIITVGYADGYPRHAANGTPLMIANQPASLAGRVSMDMIMADISDCKGIKVGDPVELWGKAVSATEVARLAGTISYELLTSVSSRVPRIYS